MTEQPVEMVQYMADSESEIALQLLNPSDSEKNNSGDEASSDSKVPTNLLAEKMLLGACHICEYRWADSLFSSSTISTHPYLWFHANEL